MVNKVGKLGVSFDVFSDKGAAGNDAPMLFPRFVQCGSGQGCGHASATKCVRDKGVIHDDTVVLTGVAKEGEAAIGLGFEALQIYIVGDQERSAHNKIVYSGCQ
jgi:hypothetical protein